MDPEIEKIIKNQIENSSPEIRKLISDPSINEKILSIGKRNKLNIEQLGVFQTETMLVMLGLVHPDEYATELQERLNTNEFMVNNIIKEMNQEILAPILDKLKELYQKTDKESKNIEDISIKDKNGNIPTEEHSSHISSLEKAMGGENKIDSILAQKLAGTFQAPKITTEYAVSPVSASTNNPMPIAPKVDPYRMPIE